MKKQSLILILILSLALVLSACGGGSDMYYDAPTNDNALMDAGEAESGGYGAGERYLSISENEATDVGDESVVTFSLKVDTAAYTNVARYLRTGNLPPADAVRTEELVNYFRYDEPASALGDSPFRLYTEVGPSPFDEDKHIALIRVTTDEIASEDLPSSNLTFLIDTSGSMESHDKLPLLKQAFNMLVETLDENDTVSIVTYAGSSEVVLDSVPGSEKSRIVDAIQTLTAGGGTAGADGINTAYELAEKNFVPGGNNRIILASDGDFNVGISNLDALKDLIGEKRDSGIYLSVLGFGAGNLRDEVMESLSADGNGNYSYIDTVSTANKVLVEERGSNLFTVADDVKAQIEFNPANVAGYRLIGYENRMLDKEDFADDTKDAGEIGAGTDVVILLEIELAGGGEGYLDYADELFEVRIAYKNPGENTGNEVSRPVTFDAVTTYPSTDFGFACSVAAFGHLLRESEYTGEATIDTATSLAVENLGADARGYRAEYLDLLELYRGLAG